MGISYNPITGNFDLVGTPSPGPSGTSSYSQSFDNTTSWGTASGGEYSITITAGTHGLGTDVMAEVYEEISPTEFQKISVSLILTTAGSVIISVLETPDLRFTGKIIIFK